MSDIFLSYAREDLPRVKPVVEALAARGWSVWWDRTIRPGQIFARVIQAALEEARCVVVLWSRDSVESDWVQSEADEGQRRGILIPALIDEVVIPLAFRRIQAANLVGWRGALPHAGFDDLTRAVEGILATTTARCTTPSMAPPATVPVMPRIERVEKSQDSRGTETEAERRVASGPSKTVRRSRELVIAGALGIFAAIGAVIVAYIGHAPQSSNSPTIAAQPPNAAPLTPLQTPENPKSIGARATGQPSKNLGAGETRDNPKDGLAYVRIPPGKFMMGCSPGDSACDYDEKPAHDVTITKGFWIGQTPVTQKAYQHVTGDNPSHFKGPRLPVEQVGWTEAQAYCVAVGMRLPTEAEWEYVARAASPAARYGDLDQIAWYGSNSGSRTHEVSQKQPNAFKLYDMLGNVWQWVADWYQENYYGQKVTIDPAGPSSGQYRVTRGGAWSDFPRGVRASVRDRRQSGRSNAVGFRCAGDLH